MRMKTGDVLTYKDSLVSVRYGTGVVTAVDSEEYTILWSGRGLTRYRRSILDEKLEQIFQRVDKSVELPRERHVQLGPSRVAVRFNENYDRARIAALCVKLKTSGARKAVGVADVLSAEFVTKKLTLRAAAKAGLQQLAEICNASNSAACDDAKNISKELFFGYVLQKSDFQ